MRTHGETLIGGRIMKSFFNYPRIFSVLLIPIIMGFSGVMNSGCKVVNGQVVYSYDELFPAGTPLSITCDGKQYPDAPGAMIMANGEFSISVPVLGGNCYFNDIIVQREVGVFAKYACDSVSGYDDCNFQLASDQDRYYFDTVQYEQKCLIIYDCEVYCEYKGECPGNGICEECKDDCNLTKCH